MLLCRKRSEPPLQNLEVNSSETIMEIKPGNSEIVHPTSTPTGIVDPASQTRKLLPFRSGIDPVLLRQEIHLEDTRPPVPTIQQHQQQHLQQQLQQQQHLQQQQLQLQQQQQLSRQIQMQQHAFALEQQRLQAREENQVIVL